MNPSETEPVKITPLPGALGGIRCRYDSGPRFSGNHTNDFAVNLTDPRDFAGYLTLGYGFACPQNANRSKFFTGKSPFHITELEVFKVDF